jgi:hypothetical protein
MTKGNASYRRGNVFSVRNKAICQMRAPKKRARANTPVHACITEVIKTVNEMVNVTTGTPNVLELVGYLQGLSDDNKAKVLEEILKLDSSF